MFLKKVKVKRKLIYREIVGKFFLLVFCRENRNLPD